MNWFAQPPDSGPGPAPPPAANPAANPARPPDPEEFVRPFIVTGGRTIPLRDGLRVETLITAFPAALWAPLAFEPRRIVQLCQTPRSIGEIAVAVAIPLGVAKVLVADLVTEGLAHVHEPPQLSVPTIERIRDLVRAL